MADGELDRLPLNQSVAAVSCGIVDGRALLDLDYSEDSTAEVDANVVMTGDGGLVEVQATAERTPLSRASLDELLALAADGIDRLRAAQEAAVARPHGPARAEPCGWCSPPATRTSCASSAQLMRRYELDPLPGRDRAAARDRRPLRRATRWARRAPPPRPPAGRRSPTTRASRPPRWAARPGVCSARFAGDHATDEDNLAKLLREVPPDGDRRVAYVCALAYVEPGGREELVRRPLRGHARARAARHGGFGYDPAFVPDDYPDDGRTMAELSRTRRTPSATAAGPPAQLARSWPSRRSPPPRRPAPGLLRSAGAPRRSSPEGALLDPVRPRAGAWRRAAAPGRAVGPAAQTPRKERAAAVSIISNTLLIALKLVAGRGHRLDRDPHRGRPLGDRPGGLDGRVLLGAQGRASRPTTRHPYGHDKVENVAAAIEGMLILVGAGVIIFESARRLAEGYEVESLGFGIAVIGFSAVANLGVSTYLYRQARLTDSPALEGDAAHLRTDAFTSVGVLVGLVLVELTGADLDRPDRGPPGGGRDRVRRRADPQPDAARACSWTRRCPHDELEAVRQADRGATARRSSSASTSCARAGRAAAATSTSTSSSATAPPRAAHTRSRTSSSRDRGGGCAAPTCSSTSSPRSTPTASDDGGPSEQVHRRRQRHGEEHSRVAEVAVEQQQQGGDQADADRHEPRDSRQRHAAILTVMADTLSPDAARGPPL